MKALIGLIFCLLLTSCTSIPLSSLIKVASLNRDDISTIKPNDIRIRLSVTEPATLQIKDVNLALKFEHYDGSQSEFKYLLEIIDDEIKKPNSWFFATETKHSYQFKLSKLSQLEFNKYQKEYLLQGKPKRYYWTVYYYLKNRPESGKKLSIDLELKLSRADDYFFLLKDAPTSDNE